MRLLYARNADGSAGSFEAIVVSGSRTDPRTSLRQLLPVYRLPSHRRRHRDHSAGPRRTLAMTSEQEKSETLFALDRPNSYIGKTVPRPNLDRLMQGRGLYVSDIELPRMVYVVFLRSPHAHAKINDIDASVAKRMPGVVAVVSGKDISTVITAWGGVLSHL